LGFFIKKEKENLLDRKIEFFFSPAVPKSKKEQPAAKLFPPFFLFYCYTRKKKKGKRVQLTD
jgi:hypothetical protein